MVKKYFDERNILGHIENMKPAAWMAYTK